MKTAGSPLSMSFPQLPARPSRVRPGGALNPTARGLVFPDLPADTLMVRVGGPDGKVVMPDADGFVPIDTANATQVEVHTPRTASSFFVRLLQPMPREVFFNDLPVYWREDTGEQIPEGYGRLELVGVPATARVQVGINTNDGSGEEVLADASELAGTVVPSRWNADRTIRSIFVSTVVPRTVRVTTADGSLTYQRVLKLEPGEIRDEILGPVRTGTSPTPAPTDSPMPTASPAPGSVPGATPGVTPSTGSALLALSVQPSTAVVLVNGNALRDTTRPVTLSPGSYRLDVSAPGYEKHTETFVAAPGRTVRLAVSLVATPTKKGWTRGQIALAAVGGAVALGGLGAVVVYLARRSSGPAPAPSLPAGSSAQALPAAGRSNPRRAASRQEEESEPDDQRPSQEDLDESIHIVERANLRFTRTRMVGGQPTEQDYTDDGVVAYYLRREIARAPSRSGLFKKLNALALSLGSPAIVSVNDHGNVTTYSYTGKVLGEWV